jgi:hypothetical protein
LAGEAHGGGARLNPATLLVGQRDDNAITGATNELFWRTLMPG